MVRANFSAFFSGETEKDLVRQLRSGSAAAFEEIYHRYWKTLLAIAFNRLADKQAAEEAVQDVFLSLWARREEVSIDSLQAYLATAVKFTVFRQLLNEKRRKELLHRNYYPQQLQFEETAIYSKFLDEYIRGIVESLPEKCRLVFKYSREEGLTIPEIAKEMNISVKTAEAHLTKALKTVRGSLKRSGFILWIYF
ncbi:MAG: RNA polymerase sigma-70 factor [Chitinophaga rupis]